MNKKNTPKPSRTNWTKLKQLKDGEIDTTDIPALDRNFFAHATLRMPIPKSTITIRLDPDILQWFKARGKGYQTLINAVLRTYTEAQRKQR